ncbi:Ferredoxin / Ferredoxin--NADP(+) reductase, actinobacterial (eukaryote-like) type [Rhodococcus wratislaviensis]|uniref:ferredoxin--NADP(+) reductase n=1 Tax=Rhodococcus wratislaviensis TaxID=44752 RepID=A0A402CDC6_RHOWR|nr:FAD-dependent oxidoreductase [Rhodococcus wratislaviensis]GCE41601.1 Ferredoxin / Ferredoxin--NADP(+) reductase, actinobacterial (eukaryote-like) type [Rhodococcus wratislaviensis]
MAHVITQPCCNDASCIDVCPVNCIHPTPDEPDFISAEMLYIDPDTCIDCGACVDECPVEAIFPDDSIDEGQERYLQINADYYTDHDVSCGLVASRKEESLPPGKELHVAIVGAGPAAFYAAEELLKHSAIRVDMFDRLPTPYGLVRAGVAPDHPSTKGVEKTFASTAAKATFEYFLHVEMGKHLNHDELTDHYGAVVYAHGASSDKQLGVDGEDLPGSIAATAFVAWYNGHPDYADRDFDLSAERAVVVGNGNVALDVARILLDDPDHLAKTDIADHALEKLRTSNIKEVVLLGRRGIAQAAYTNAEFLAMGDMAGVDVIIDPQELILDSVSREARDAGTLDSTIATKVRIAEEYAEREPTAGNKRVVFRYLISPVAIKGSASGIETIRCARNEFVYAPDESVDNLDDMPQPDSGRAAIASSGEEFDLDAGLLMRAIGYTGLPLDGLPFDGGKGVVPNESGRVLDARSGKTLEGVYVTGWIKRGATGGIGMNRLCGQETAAAVIADFAKDNLPQPAKSREEIPALIADRGARRIDDAGWKNIDLAERTAGKEAGRRRVKMVSIEAMVRAANA